jgi:hypothetical protein
MEGELAFGQEHLAAELAEPPEGLSAQLTGRHVSGGDAAHLAPPGLESAAVKRIVRSK